MAMRPSPAVVPDMNAALAMFIRRYHAIPKEERDADLQRQAAIRARRQNRRAAHANRAA